MKNKQSFPQQIDSSMRSTFASCPRKFFFQYMLKKAAGTDSVHLVFGGAMARGLEVTRRAIWRDNLRLEEALHLGSAAIVKDWLHSSIDPEPGDSPKSLANCIKALEMYFQHFSPYDDYMRPMPFGNGEVAVEFTFAVPLPTSLGFPLHPETGLPILYTGRFDMLGETPSGMKMIVDDKTCSQLGLNFTRSMKMRSQFTGYTWACQQYGIDTSAIVVRATCIQKTQITFAELQEMRPDHMIQQWLSQLRKDVTHMIEMWKVHNYMQDLDGPLSSGFEANLDDSCGSYGGCPYLDACLAPKPLEVINAFYKDHHWDPLAKGKE